MYWTEMSYYVYSFKSQHYRLVYEYEEENYDYDYDID